MYPNRSEHSHGRQYSDRSSRQWDCYDDRREDRRETHRDSQWSSHHKYDGNDHRSTERTSRTREYSDSPKRPYSKDWGRKSPVRRRTSSPDWGASEKKRQRYAEDKEDDYRYRRVSEDKSSRWSPDSFSRSHRTKDYKQTPPHEEDFKYKKTTPDSRHRYRHEEFDYRQQKDDLNLRRSSGYYEDGKSNQRSWDHSSERPRSQDRSAKSYPTSRERNHSSYQEDHCHSSEHEANHHSAAVPGQRSTKGFQRFLDVLNKGVDVAMLTKIVTQTPEDGGAQSTTSFMNNANRPWSPSSAERRRETHQNTNTWYESKGSQSLASPPPRHRSRSPNGCSLSNEKSLQRWDGERSKSPLVLERVRLTPEDDHKQKHVQDVLQAIGIDLGFEELGQMSHRIQERLYGKKENDVSHQRRGSKEKDTWRVLSPRLQSSSSSSRSSFSPSPQEYYGTKDSYSAQRDEAAPQQAAYEPPNKYDHSSVSHVSKENEKCETYPQQSAAACQSFPQTPTFSLPSPAPAPAPAPMLPMYSQVNCSPLPYTAPRPPILPQVRPGLFFPRLPPFLPYPHIPPLNVLPAVIAQARHLLPQPLPTPHPLLNLPIPPVKAAQKPKAEGRPRCLQVIETKQPG